MPSQKNLDQVKVISEQFDQAKSVIIADYSGLNAKAQVELRAKLAEVGGQFSVIKNRLFKIVAQDKLGGGNDDLDNALLGQNAFLFSMEDAVSALKAMFEFAKDNEALEIKLGILDGKVLTQQETENLSKLPSKPELIVQLMSRLNGPAYGLVNVMTGPARGLVYALNAIKDQKSA